MAQVPSEESLRFRLQPEAQSRSVAHRSQNTGGVVDEATGVQNANLAQLQVSRPAEGVQKAPPISRVQRHGDCIRGEVPSLQVLLDRARGDRRQRARPGVGLRTGHGDVNLHVAHDELGRLELGARDDLAPDIHG